MKILIVLSSNQQLGESGKKTGFWLEEFTTPYYLFRDAGIAVTLASPRGGQPPVDPQSANLSPEPPSNARFRGDTEAQKALANTILLSGIDAKDYDAVYYPGGHGLLWDLVDNKDSIQILEGFYNAGKPTGLVCHAPAALRNAKTPAGHPIVYGKRVNSFSNTEEVAVGLESVVPYLLEDELTRLGGHYSKAADWQPYVVADGNLVTGQNPASSAAVAQRLLSLLQGDAASSPCKLAEVPAGEGDCVAAKE